MTDRLGRWAPWLLLLAALVFAYLTRAVLLPFVFGLAVAYLLDPVADRLEGWGVPRGLASVLILAVFFLSGLGLLLALWPLLQSQLIGLIGELPAALARLRPLVEDMVADLSARFDFDLRTDGQSLAATMAERGLNQLSAIVGSFVSGGIAFFSLLSLLLISPVVAFYLLRDYDALVARIDALLPTKQRPVIEEQLGKIDKALSGFVRGQITVCTIMGALYAVGWSLVGLNYALVLGILAGVLSFIPFLGMVAAAVIAVLVALGQFGADPVQLGLVVGVYVAVQVLEGSVLTPRIVGDRVGLHPVWVLFAVFAGGEVAGFVGVLLAVPAAAVIGVLVRFSIDQFVAPHAQPADQAQVPPDRG